MTPQAAGRVRRAAWAVLLGLAGLVPLPGQAAGTLTYCAVGSPEGFDMAQYETEATFDAAGSALYDQLTAIAPDSLEVRPALAESWQVSADGLQYTLNLRRGVSFHTTPWFTPSRTMNADDVLFSFRRMLDKSHPAHAAARRGFMYWDGMGMGRVVQAVDKLDDRTVRFTLKRPEAPFLADLAISPIGSVYSAEYAEQLRAAGRPEELNSKPVGTGPFVLKSYQKDAVLRYAPHPSYWAGAPAIDQLVFAITRDSDLRAQRLKAGECLIGDIKNEAAAQFTAPGGPRALSYQPLATLTVAPNHEHEFVRDRRFREALWLALDKDALIRGAYDGHATSATSFLPARMWSVDRTLPERRDPARARQLVTASGYDGRVLQLFVTDDPFSRRRGELLQADWARIGVKVALQAYEEAEALRRTSQGEHDLALVSWWSDNADPDNFLTPVLSCEGVASGTNKSRWCDARFDALLDAARRSNDRARRSELYRQAQRLVYDEVALIPLLYPGGTVVLSPRVQAYVPGALGLHDFRAVRLK